MSTSSTEEVAYGYAPFTKGAVFVITNPTSAVQLNSWEHTATNNEQESLFLPGAQFRINKIEHNRYPLKPDIITYHIEEITEDATV